MCVHLKYVPYPQISALAVTKKKGPGKDGDYCIHFQVTPLTALKFAELTVKAGFPKGVINIIPGSGKPAGRLCSDRPATQGAKCCFPLQS